MRVLIIHPSFYVYGGGEILIVRLCNYLSRRGVQNSILTTDMIPEIRADLVNTEVLIETTPSTPPRSIRERYGMQIDALRKGLHQHQDNFDIFNPHNYPAEIVAASGNKPSVWMCNEPELYLTMNHPGFKTWLSPDRIYLLLQFIKEKSLVKKKLKNVVVSDEFNARRFHSIYGFDPRIINYGIDYEFFSATGGDSTQQKDDLPGKYIILHVGMITPFKNQMASLRALDANKGAMPDSVLVFAGGGYDEAYKKQIDDYIQEHGLTGRVFFKGHVNRNELRSLYHRADVMIHPVKSQGGWLSPFEMMSAGKPVIVSKELTASYLIEQNRVGVVTDNYDEALLDIYRHHENYSGMIGHGRDYVRNNLSWDSFGEKMLAAYTAAV